MGTDEAGAAAGAAAEAAGLMAFKVPSGAIWDTPENFDRVFGKPAVAAGALIQTLTYRSPILPYIQALSGSHGCRQ